jgi:pantoate kinase
MTFFAPASITCFFSAKFDEKPFFSGSTGVGVTLDLGARVKIVGKDVTVNGRKWDFPTVNYVIKKLGCDCGVEISMDVPAGCGFGMSGASALATAFEINRVFELNKTFFELADLAHEAEITCRTGMGDVLCQCLGGVVVRRMAGAPSKAFFDRLLWNYELDFLILESISTEEILQNHEKIEKINRFGEQCLKKFLEKPDFKNLFLISREFSEKTGFLDDEVREIVDRVEAEGGMASMVMLGRVVFAYNGFDVLKDYGKPFKANISQYGLENLTV